jgi:hypothetical protein
MFQDLVYSIEIAAHDARLEHYAPRMYFDAVSVTQRYNEYFVPEDWSPPFNARAEIEFELDSLDIARSQMSDRDIAKSLGVMIKDDGAEDGPKLTPITVDLDVKFSLTINALAAQSEEWDAYRHKVAGRDLLQAGLENMKHKLQRAIGDEGEHPALYVEAHSTLTSSGNLMLNELVGHWPVCIEADIPDDVRQDILEDIMTRVHAGLDALSEFAQGIREDYAARTANP